MIRDILYPLLLAAVCIVNPQPGQAASISAVLCIGPEFPCAPGDVVDSGIRFNGVGVLGANRYTLLPFSFDDPAASFTGTLLAVDSQGKFIYLWGGGVGTDKLGAPLWLDVQLSQTYLTVPGTWSFSEFNSGTCNPAATAAADSVLATLAINGGTPLPTLLGACSPFAAAGGPVSGGLGFFTNLTALAQFKFNVGAGGQEVDLPWGLDFPDPGITIFPDPDHLPAGFTEQAPEPAAGLLAAGGLLLIALWRRGRKPAC